MGGVWDDIPCGGVTFFGLEVGEKHLGFCEYSKHIYRYVYTLYHKNIYTNIQAKCNKFNLNAIHLYKQEFNTFCIVLLKASVQVHISVRPVIYKILLNK